MWDIDYGRHTAVRRVGHPCSFTRWSPDDSKLFCATAGDVFRVWDTHRWTPERWCVKTGGTVQSAAWSPCGLHLLFVTSEDQLVYALKFADEQLFSSAAVPKQALPVADLAEAEAGATPQQGRRPHELVWDARGRFLAVSYKDANLVSLFRTRIGGSHSLSLSAAGSVASAVPEEVPTQICFQPRVSAGTEAVLTIGWSSGRIQYKPLS